MEVGAHGAHPGGVGLEQTAYAIHGAAFSALRSQREQITIELK